MTPNIVAATSGRSSCTSTGGACTMPAIAAAALARICAEIELMPATSVTEAIIAMSATPTYSRVSPAAIVETISFGTPTGSACIARVAIAVLPEPPAARMPWMAPSPCSRRASTAAASAIAVTAAPRSPASVSAARSTPAAAATSSRAMSGSQPCGGPPVPTSATSTSAPPSRRRSRR